MKIGCEPAPAGIWARPSSRELLRRQVASRRSWQSRAPQTLYRDRLRYDPGTTDRPESLSRAYAGVDRLPIHHHRRSRTRKTRRAGRRRYRRRRGMRGRAHRPDVGRWARGGRRSRARRRLLLAGRAASDRHGAGLDHPAQMNFLRRGFSFSWRRRRWARAFLAGWPRTGRPFVARDDVAAAAAGILNRRGPCRHDLQRHRPRAAFPARRRGGVIADIAGRPVAFRVITRSSCAPD